MILTGQQLNEIDRHVDLGYLSRKFHPEESGLCILNYTAKTAYDRKWNDTTMMCRGLIMYRDTGRVLARPLKKFFNIEEHDIKEFDGMKFEAYEKLDGSMGVLYWLKGKPFIATRGAFDSPQAIKANEMLQDMDYSELLQYHHGGRTVIFEIIYPENRIVVDYGSKEELFILAIVNNETGADTIRTFRHFSTPGSYLFDSLNELMKNQEPSNCEGYVLKFENGVRVKFKFEEYRKLHKLIFQTTNKTVWEMLTKGDSFDFIDNINLPQDLKNWIYQLKYDFEFDYDHIERYCKKHLEPSITDRKQLAGIYTKKDYQGILFFMHDKKEYKQAIWKLLKPKETTFFKQEV